MCFDCVAPRQDGREAKEAGVSKVKWLGSFSMDANHTAYRTAFRRRWRLMCILLELIGYIDLDIYFSLCSRYTEAVKTVDPFS
jgi:hypothetical protein